MENPTTPPAYTQGPWQIDRGTDDELRVYKLIGQSPMVIADLFGYDPDSTEEYEANARLIAAAPELLERAKALLDNWENGNLSGYIQSLAAAVLQAEGH